MAIKFMFAVFHEARAQSALRSGPFPVISVIYPKSTSR